MCQVHDAGFGCDRRVRAAYREGVRAGQPVRAAYAAALAEFQRLHPRSSGFATLGAVKDLLSEEPALGLVDSGELAAG